VGLKASGVGSDASGVGLETSGIGLMTSGVGFTTGSTLVGGAISNLVGVSFIISDAGDS
jgi:hypothetical protein